MPFRLGLPELVIALCLICLIPSALAVIGFILYKNFKKKP